MTTTTVTNNAGFSFRRVLAFGAYYMPRLKWELIIYAAISLICAILCVLPVVEDVQTFLSVGAWALLPLLFYCGPLIFAKGTDTRMLERMMPVSAAEKLTFYYIYILVIIPAVVFILPMCAAWIYMSSPSLQTPKMMEIYNLKFNYGIIWLINISGGILIAMTCLFSVEYARQNRMMFGSGAASVVSRLLGRGNTARAEQVASTAVYGGLIVGAVVIGSVMAFLHPVLKLLGASESIMPFAVSYARIYVASCLFTVFNVTMNSIAASEGAAKTTMCALLIGATLNIALDPLFIYAFGLGVAGASLATAVSQMVSTCVYLAYILRKKSLFRFRFSDCTFTAETLSGIFKIGAPTLAFQILAGVSISLTNNAALRYGDPAIAAMGIVTRLISLGSLSVFGFVKGFQPVAGYSYGAKNIVRLREVVKIAILWTTAFCAAFALVLAAFPAAIVSQFASGNAEVIRIGAAALRANGISMTLFGFCTVYSALFLALGKGGAGFVLGACRQGICFVPVMLLLPNVFGLNGILYAQPIADALSAAVTVCMAVSLHRKLKSM